MTENYGEDAGAMQEKLAVAGPVLPDRCALLSSSLAVALII